jgi:threonine/homoserine/homoserine lactone efflux protein
MPPTALFLTFLATTAAFAFIPGPAMVYAAAQTMARGRRAGLMASLGLHLGGYAHVAIAAAGLSVLFHLVPMLYLAVKLAGAAYLVWLGIALFRAAAPENQTPRAEAKSGRRALVESISVEVLNPKTAIFFMAFLPQFIDTTAAAPVWLQFVMLGAIVNLMFSLTDIACVLLADWIVRKAGPSGRLQALIRRAGGALIVGLGIRLAAQTG